MSGKKIGLGDLVKEYVELQTYLHPTPTYLSPDSSYRKEVEEKQAKLVKRLNKLMPDVNA